MRIWGSCLLFWLEEGCGLGDGDSVVEAVSESFAIVSFFDSETTGFESVTASEECGNACLCPFPCDT